VILDSVKAAKAYALHQSVPPLTAFFPRINTTPISTCPPCPHFTKTAHT
jgi:hypothetical protein